MVDYTGKMRYTQADGALTGTFKTFSFSVDGTNEVKPNAVIIKNDDTSGTDTIVGQINDNPTDGNFTLAPGKGLRYSIKKVKFLALKFSGGAPNWSVEAVR